MALKFGTSGLRGLVTDMSPEVIERYTTAFLTGCKGIEVLCVGRDLRASSPRIAGDVMRAAAQIGCNVIDCGAVPTPALALAAVARGAGAVMVTGSHIPADRNGLKFYTQAGEITKDDEKNILASFETARVSVGAATGVTSVDENVAEIYIDRYVNAFGDQALAGKRIGVYSHSAVGRDILHKVLTRLGAEVVECGRSDIFIPVDTEAVDPDTRTKIKNWVQTENLDALVSTDGDSDRPLLADENGQIVPGDVMGQITAQYLEAETVVTPISSNSGVTQKGFDSVTRTKIGSPFVIAGMNEAGGRVVGYEANGGFLLGYEADGPEGPLPPLSTRDAVLPLIAVLSAAGSLPLSARVSSEPAVFTAADRLQEVEQSRTRPFMQKLAEQSDVRGAFLKPLGGEEAHCDLTDGVRMSLRDGRVVHVRPSGNAPELRLYIEAETSDAANELLADGLHQLQHML